MFFLILNKKISLFYKIIVNDIRDSKLPMQHNGSEALKIYLLRVLPLLLIIGITLLARAILSLFL
jgi:hypothetical protein